MLINSHRAKWLFFVSSADAKRKSEPEKKNKGFLWVVINQWCYGPHNLLPINYTKHPTPHPFILFLFDKPEALLLQLKRPKYQSMDLDL